VKFRAQPRPPNFFWRRRGPGPNPIYREASRGAGWTRGSVGSGKEERARAGTCPVKAGPPGSHTQLLLPRHQRRVMALLAAAFQANGSRRSSRRVPSMGRAPGAATSSSTSRRTRRALPGRRAGPAARDAAAACRRRRTS
jgi:hypothetical protein